MIYVCANMKVTESRVGLSLDNRAIKGTVQAAIKANSSLQCISIRFKFLSIYQWNVENCFIPVQDQSITHTTIVRWVCFVQQVTIRPKLKIQGVKIEISDILTLFIGYM